MKLNKVLILFIIIIAGSTLYLWQSKAKTDTNIDLGSKTSVEIKEENQPTTYTKKVEIVEGSTYGILMAEAEVDPTTSTRIFNAAIDLYDLSKIRIGKTLNLVYEKETDKLIQLIYQIDTEDELYVTINTSTPELVATSTEEIANEAWKAEVVPIEYEIKIKEADGIIETSMYQTALDNGIDIRAIIELANAFQWSVDFSMDVQKEDSFSFVYEERYRNGEYIMPGEIKAGKFTNMGVDFYVFYYEESKDNKGYFDENGNSVQKMFLKAPVAYKYISSGFTTGQRYVKAFNVSTGHRAIDYAAPAGTPIRSVGDGTVAYAGWNGPYGNFITVRHNGTYSTNYAHMSKFAVKSGIKVKQGDTIGYVGSTGFSTGPHLHYEMVKNGSKVNPLKEVLPPGESIAEENKQDYFDVIAQYKEKLDSIN